MTAFDKALHDILSFFEGAQVYFLETASTVAILCFVLSFGIDSIKVVLGGENLSKMFVKHFMALITYFMLLWLFPIGLPWLNTLMHEWGYGAIFGEGIEMEVNPSEGSEGEFYQWLADNSPLFTATSISESGNEQAVKKVLNFNIMNETTGMISLNKALTYPLTVAQILWMTISDVIKFTEPLTWVLGLLGLLTSIVSLFCIAMILINYIMALVDFCALQGFGLIMIPLSLFNGTKSYLETLLGGVGKISVKLLVITAIVYINVASTLNIMVAIYETTGELSEFFDLCLSVLLMSVILFVLSKEATTIAGFLSGDMPRLSYGEFARAATSTGASVGMTGATGKGIAGAAISAGASGIAAMTAAGASAYGASSMGGSGASAFGTSLTSSLGNGMQSFAGSAMGSGKSLSGALERSHTIMSGGGSPVSAESMGSRGYFGGSAESGGGFGTRGGSGTENASESSQTFAQNVANILQGKDGANENMAAYAEQQQASSSAKDRLRGGFANYASQRVNGASHKDAFHNSVDTYVQNEQNRNPGTASFDKDELSTQSSPSPPPKPKPKPPPEGSS